MNILNNILTRLQEVKGNGEQYTAKCPAHDDQKASLSIALKGGKILFKCFAGCDVSNIVKSIGLEMKDLFEDNSNKNYLVYNIKEESYEYTDEKGEIVYRKRRFDQSDGTKFFGFYLPDGTKGIGRTLHVPYRLHKLADAQTIYIVEGEKCVHAVEKAGYTATTLDGGAMSPWRKNYSQYFEGKKIIILPDNDDPGLRYAINIKKELPHAIIKLLPNLPSKGDIYDWLEKGHKINEIDELPDFEPEMKIAIEKLPGFIEINPFEDGIKHRYRWDDIGTSNWFADACKNICRYCPDARSWYIYNGSVWRLDTGGTVTAQCGKAFTDYMLDCRKYIYNEEQRENWVKYVAKRMQNKYRYIMIDDAKSVYPISIHEFDKDPYLLNVQNGTIDLRTFELKPHNPDDFLSKIANVTFDKNAYCDRWERFITEIMQDDKDKAQFMQKALGYSLTGDTSEECFFIFYGNTTRNGKGTTAETVLHILGDYGRTAQPETIAQKQTSNGGAPSEDVARLKGARFVNMSEPDKGLRLNSALVKSMTGGDTITARFLHQNSFEFRPEYKLFINTNHLPKVNDDSIFASGRVKLIPFERHFHENEQDKGLKTFFRQKDNKSGILNWLLEGLKLLKADGLKQPKSVRDATAQYREDSDIIGQFISECLIETRNINTPLKNIHIRYEEWCEDYGNRPLNSRNLAAELRRKGKKVDRGTDNKVCLFDYCLIADDEDLPVEWQ